MSQSATFNLMSLKDLAKELGKPVSTINTWRIRNELPAELFIKIGSTVFVKVNKFKQWIDDSDSL